MKSPLWNFGANVTKGIDKGWFHFALRDFIMHKPRYELGSSIEMDKRYNQASEFYAAALNEDEQPWFVADEATLWAIYCDEEDLLIQRVLQHYGVLINKDHFDLPVWQLIDYLESNRKR